MDAAQQSTVVESVPNARPPWLQGGSRKGVPNRATQEAKRIATMLAENEAENFSKWLNEVAVGKPERACELYLKLIELVLPKTAPTASFAAMTTAPDGTQSAIGMKMRGMLGLPPVIESDVTDGA